MLDHIYIYVDSRKLSKTILKCYWIAIILMFGSRFFQSSNFPIGLSMIRKHFLVIVDFPKIDIRTHTHEHTKPVKLSIQCLSSFLWNSVCCWARVLDLSSYPFVGRTIESKQNICVHKRRRKKKPKWTFQSGLLKLYTCWAFKIRHSVHIFSNDKVHISMPFQCRKIMFVFFL